jgi:hypothetical protein
MWDVHHKVKQGEFDQQMVILKLETLDVLKKKGYLEMDESL